MDKSPLPDVVFQKLPEYPDIICIWKQPLADIFPPDSFDFFQSLFVELRSAIRVIHSSNFSSDAAGIRRNLSHVLPAEFLFDVIISY